MSQFIRSVLFTRVSEPLIARIQAMLNIGPIRAVSIIEVCAGFTQILALFAVCAIIWDAIVPTAFGSSRPVHPFVIAVVAYTYVFTPAFMGMALRDMADGRRSRLNVWAAGIAWSRVWMWKLVPLSAVLSVVTAMAALALAIRYSTFEFVAAGGSTAAYLFVGCVRSSAWQNPHVRGLYVVSDPGKSS